MSLVKQFKMKPSSFLSRKGLGLEKGLSDWLAGAWDKLVERYGRRGAIAFVVAQIVASPLPGSIGLVIAGAEALRRFNNPLPTPAEIGGKSLKEEEWLEDLARAVLRGKGISGIVWDDSRMVSGKYQDGTLWYPFRCNEDGKVEGFQGPSKVAELERWIEESKNPTKAIGGMSHSRYMLHGLVQEFRSFMERLRQFGIRVPSLSDEQIARTLERAMVEADQMEFGRKGLSERQWRNLIDTYGLRGTVRDLGGEYKLEIPKDRKLFFEELMGKMGIAIRESEGGTYRIGKSIVLPDERQDESWSCGAAAVVSVCRWFGIEPDTESEAIQALGSSPSDGTPPWNIVGVLEQNGLAVDAHDWFDLDELTQNHLDRGHPVLAPIQMYGDPADYQAGEGGHWVVIEGNRDGKVCVQDPVAGRVEMGVDEFLSRWHDKGADGTPYERFGIACWKPAYGKSASSVDALYNLYYQGHPKDWSIPQIETLFRDLSKDEVRQLAEKMGHRPNISRTDLKNSWVHRIESWNRIQFRSLETWYTDSFAFPMMRQSSLMKRKGLGLTKDGGTCKQGERADLTGCSPATDSSGSGDSSPKDDPKNDAKQRDIQNVKEALQRAEAAGKKKQAQQLRQMLAELGGDERPEGTPESKQEFREFQSKKDMEKWGKENFSEWKNNLDSGEKKALLQYAGPMFFDSNSALRKGEPVPEKWKQSVDDLDKAIAKSTIPNDVVAYRGLWLDGKEQSKQFIDKFMPGAVLSDPGFLSTSINREIASDFGGEKLGAGIVIEMRIPKGTKGAYMDVLPENAKHFKQNELLLGRGTKFKVVSIDKGKAIVEVVNE